MTDEQLFDIAIGIQTKDLAGFLRTNCHDEEQRHRIESLLAAHKHTDSLLDTQSVDVSETAIQGTAQTIGDFEVRRELGRGGMGVVYEAQQKSLKRRVALKLLSSGLGLSSKAILRFRREAEAAGKLHHTNIVPIYTTGEDRGVHFYAMELIDGPSLDAVIAALRSESKDRNTHADSSKAEELPAWVKETALFDGPKSKTNARVSSKSQIRSNFEMSKSSIASGNGYFDQVAMLIAEVADALDHAHEHGVIHRDVKPSNLLLAPDGRLSVNDFGLAKMLEQPGMTMTGEFVGSPLYMSPEQITAGRAPLDHRTDIYSLGATLYELLTLQPPFPGETRDQVIGQVLHKDAQSPRKLNRRIPIDLETICMKAIDKDPDRRYQTAGQLAEDLRSFVNRYAISARRTSPIAKSLRWIKRNPSLAGFCSLAILLTVVGLWSYQSQRTLKLRHAMRLASGHSLQGEFVKAEQQIEQARGLGASEDWIDFMTAQRRLIEGDFRQVGAILDRHVANEEIRIKALCLKAIAKLYDGLESEHVDLIIKVKALAKDKALTEEECLYLGMALMWAEPYSSLDFLDQAETPNTAIMRLLRAHAYANASLDSTSKKQTLEFAEEALHNAVLARADLPESQFPIMREFAANFNYAFICRRFDDPRRNVFENRVRKLQSEISRDSASNNSIHYQFLVEFGEEDEALTFINSLNDRQLVDYLRIYRMFTEIHEGNIKNVQEDFNSFTYHREFREPIAQIVELAHGVSLPRRKSIYERYSNNLWARLEREEFDTLEFSWALAKLLEAEEGLGDGRALTKVNLNKVRTCITECRGTYIADIYQPMIDIETLSPEQVIKKSRHSRRRLSVAFFVAGIHTLASGKSAAKALSYFQRCADEGFPTFYTYAFSLAMVERLGGENLRYYWCIE